MLFDNRVKAGGGDGCHIEHATDRVSAAFTESFPGKFTGIASERGDSNKCGDLSIGKDAEFGQIGNQGSTKCRADAGNRLQEFVSFSACFALFDLGGDLGFGVLDLTLQEANMVLDTLLS